MKKAGILLLTLTLCFALTSCGNPGTDMSYSSLESFSEAEIKSAEDTVRAMFRDAFKGCELRKLWYEEMKSDAAAEFYQTNGRGSVNGAKKENVIVLFSDFYVDASGGDGILNLDSIYYDWQWFLIKDDANSEWELSDWGY